MTAQAPAADSQLMAQTDRERELLNRIEVLEAPIATAKQALTQICFRCTWCVSDKCRGLSTANNLLNSAKSNECKVHRLADIASSLGVQAESCEGTETLL